MFRLFLLCFLHLRWPKGDTSIFSSMPLGFYILGSMLMLVGAKYLAGWCFHFSASIFVPHLSPSINMKRVNKYVGLASIRSPLKTGLWKQEPGNGHWPHFYSTVDPEATSVPSSWKLPENQGIKSKEHCYFSSFFFKLKPIVKLYIIF